PFTSVRPHGRGDGGAGARRPLPALASAGARTRGALILLQFLGEPDEDAFGPSDVAEPIRVFVLNELADELRTELSEPGKCGVDVFDGEHDAEVAERVHWRGAMVG